MANTIMGAPKDTSNYETPITGSTTVVAPGSTVVDPMLVGITEAMIKAHPELKSVRDAYVKGDYAAAINALYSSDFYKNTGSTAFANEEMRVNQPGVYDKTINEQWLPTLRNYATQQGLKVSDATLTAIAQKSFGLGLNPNSAGTLELFRGTDETTGKPYVEGIVGGAASTARSNISTLNADYGAGFNQDWIDKAATSVAEGTTTEQFWTDQLKAHAVGAYPAWADQINAGMTVKQIATPYINTYANILGIDPASITMNDTLLKQGLQGTDPAKPAAMPLWQFEKQVRQDPRWAVSKDAMDSLSNTGTQILKQWGLMS